MNQPLPGYLPGTPAPTPPPRRSSGLKLGLVVAVVLAVALLVSTVTFGLLWSAASERAESSAAQARQATADLDARMQQESDDAKAREVAQKYAVGAATFDYRDLGAWHTPLTTGVTGELKARFENMYPAMKQLLVPLQWVSKASSPSSTVLERKGSIYKVAAYVEVTATNTQRPSGTTMVTRYLVTLDKSKNWVITDLGGALPGS